MLSTFCPVPRGGGTALRSLTATAVLAGVDTERESLLIVHGLDKVDPSLHGCALTIGNYDGVHRAHRELLDNALDLTEDDGGDVVVLTFEPHPLTVLRPESAPERLTLPESKLSLLACAGVSAVVVLESEPSLFELSPPEFVERIIIGRLRPKHIVEGPSFGFGKNRAGTAETLRRLATPHGCDVHILDPFHLTLGEAETVMVSSSLIRNLLAQGRVGDAATCLGRAYSLQAEVIRGDARGRTIGFPTANLAETGQLVPAEGVYAGRAVISGVQHACAISVGSSPTFDGKTCRVEAHLLDFDADIYGKRLGVHFQRFLRPQQKYGSTDALVDQLHRDVEAARKLSTELDDIEVACHAKEERS